MLTSKPLLQVLLVQTGSGQDQHATRATVRPTIDSIATCI